MVKGVNFAGLRDAGDPVELARRYDEQGADELTFLDITASSGGRETTYEVVRRTAEQVFIPLTVGGGVRTVADVDALLRAGADKVGVNTAAIARPDLISRDRPALRPPGARAVGRRAPRRRADDAERVRGHHARRAAGHRDRRGRLDGAAAELGAGEILLNSMDADGTKDGYDLRADPPGPRRRGRPGDRQRGSGKAGATSRPRSRPAPTPCSPPACSTSAS